MKRISQIAILMIAALVSCKDAHHGQKKPLTKETREQLITELQKMLKADQQNRSYIAFQTFDQDVIDSVKKLPLEQHIEFMQSFKQALLPHQIDSLWAIQHRLDSAHTQRLYSLIEEYGWLTSTQLDSTVQPFVILLHTPRPMIEPMQELLWKEVKSHRMDALDYAKYVDNMRKKAFGQAQLYGTGDEFDPETNSILPPYIENIDSTNAARKKIGLPELQQGEYRSKNQGKS